MYNCGFQEGMECLQVIENIMATNCLLTSLYSLTYSTGIMIKLYKTEQGWMAQFSDPAIRGLFGTDTIPTAYTAQANAEKVRAAIQERNPIETVEVLRPFGPWGYRRNGQ